MSLALVMLFGSNAAGQLVSGRSTPEILAEARTLDSEVDALDKQGDFTKERQVLKREVSLLSSVMAPDDVLITSSLNRLVLLDFQMGNYREAEPFARSELAIRQKKLAWNDPDLAVAWNNIGIVDSRAGRFNQANDELSRALLAWKNAPAPRDDQVAYAYNNLGTLEIEEGRLAQAEDALRQAVALRQKSLPDNDPNIPLSINNLAEDLYEEGRYGEAETLYEQALNLQEQDLRPGHPDIYRTMYNMAALYKAEGEYKHAAVMYRAVLAMQKTAFTEPNPDEAFTLTNIAKLDVRDGNYVEAERLQKEALTIRKAALGTDHPDYAQTLSNLAELYSARKEWAKAYRFQRKALAIRIKAFGSQHPTVAESLSDLGDIEFSLGDYAKAKSDYEGALAIDRKTLGNEHPAVIRDLAGLASTQDYLGEKHAALVLFDEARHTQLSIMRRNIGLDDKALDSLARANRGFLFQYLEALTRSEKQSKKPTPQAAMTAFVVVEQLRAGVAQQALARAALRSAVADPATAELTRKVQDLHNRREATVEQLTAAYEESPNAEVLDRIRYLQNATNQIDKDLDGLSTELRTAFPKYSEFAAPDPINVEETANELSSGEALVSYFVSGSQLLAWLIRRDKPVLYSFRPIERTAVKASISRLRRSLQPRTLFDVVDARSLYKLLLEPFERDLANVNHLIVVPDDLLLPVPFAALITSDTSEYGKMATMARSNKTISSDLFSHILNYDYPKLPWLLNAHYSLSILPSATSLRLLRQNGQVVGADQRKTSTKEKFIGIGDPILEGAACGERGGSMPRTRGDDEVQALTLDQIRMLPRLCGAEAELNAEADALKVPRKKALLLRDQARKPVVMGLKDSRLREVSVLSFATHALVGGRVEGVTEPALVLTPPAVETAEDNGLLAIDDIVRLELKNNRWLILSACNTDSPDGSGEGLSGLTRAFFYAGASSIIVSQWSVDDRAAQRFMTLLFDYYGANSNPPHALALQAAARSLLLKNDIDTAYLHHPYAWAPFMLVGKGGE
jgi:CHAT domain-containing protein/tetratricopeptide (TPR) repeat protein